MLPLSRTGSSTPAISSATYGTMYFTLPLDETELESGWTDDVTAKLPFLVVVIRVGSGEEFRGVTGCSGAAGERGRPCPRSR